MGNRELEWKREDRKIKIIPNQKPQDNVLKYSRWNNSDEEN